MKTVFLKGPLALLCMILMLVYNIHAQNSTATTDNTSPTASKSQVQKPATVPKKSESKNSVVRRHTTTMPSVGLMH